MQIVCPACGKKNDAETCARCGSDLVPLRAIRAAAAAHLAAGRAKLIGRDWPAALAHAEDSWILLHTSQSARLACLATAALGDVSGLAQWRRRVQE
jgi:hypothetical protein